MKCIFCNTDIPDGATFCRFCGTKQIISTQNTNDSSSLQNQQFIQPKPHTAPQKQQQIESPYENSPNVMPSVIPSENQIIGVSSNNPIPNNNRKTNSANNKNIIFATVGIVLILIVGVVAYKAGSSKSDVKNTAKLDNVDIQNETTEESYIINDDTDTTESLAEPDSTINTTENTIEETDEKINEATTEAATESTDSFEEESPGSITEATSTGYWKYSPFNFAFFVPADFQLTVSGTYDNEIKGYSYYMTNEELGMNIYIEEVDKGSNDRMSTDYEQNISVYGDANYYTLDYEYNDDSTYVLSGTNLNAGDIYYYKYKDLGSKCCRIEFYYESNHKDTCDQILVDFLDNLDYDTTD